MNELINYYPARHPAEFILQGPLLSVCGHPGDDMADWLAVGKQLALQLGFDHDKMDAVQK